ncbi:coiled-coil domain-containing protein AGAP005037-like [Arctopsyche grandis]|uniref:coiled-coil domain-containing protein AGAP005037-like n=1 Tax=Arctopsyche grandis TaxID=121162 RepID=UPI00406DA4D0
MNPIEEGPNLGAEIGGPGGGVASLSIGGGVSADAAQRTENALDALLDELQTFARPPSPGLDGEEELGLLRRLRSCTSTSGESELSPPVAPRGQSATKPPVPERNPDLLQMAAGRRAPPPPPPRTSSRSPLASPATPLVPLLSPSNSSSCDSVDSQEPVSKAKPPTARHDLLEQRHQELLKKQKALQEQYARLQQIQRGGSSLTVVPPPDLKKTGSESNLLTKMGLSMTPVAPISGSLTHLAGTFPRTHNTNTNTTITSEITTDLTPPTPPPPLSTKVYETDIL